PRCQDYGRIFLADNMVVAPSACTPPSIVDQPADVTTCRSGTASFGVSTDGSPVPSRQWEREDTPGVYVPLLDGPTGHGSTITGARESTLMITDVSEADAARYRCVVANDCGSAASNGALLILCSADFNCDAQANSQDFF